LLTRQKEFLQWIIGGVSTAAVIVGGVWTNHNRSMLLAELEGRVITTSASVATTTKVDILNQHEEAKGPENKGAGALKITLTSPDGRRSDGTLVLNAKVVATTELEGLKYEWVLPDGVTLVSGALDGDIGTLAEGASNAQDVTLNVSAQTNSFVHFHAYRLSGGEKVGQLAQYNTLEQESINSSLAFTRQSIESAQSRKPASTSGSDQPDHRRME
jgi:hypothetical protein